MVASLLLNSLIVKADKWPDEKTMDYFPIFTDLSNKQVLLVGGGEVAARKLELLVQAKASIQLVAPNFSHTVIQLAEEYPVELVKDRYQTKYLENKDLVVAATNDSLVNQKISQEAQARHLFVNVVDQPELCTFITPAIVDRAPITIAISTAGKAPVLARLLRGKIESMIPSAYGKLAQLAEKYRDRIKQTFKTGTERKNFWEQVFEGEVAEKVFQNNDIGARKAFMDLVHQTKNEQAPAKGEVYLIGAGPGDADLLTFRALRLMQKADVVVYDRLVSKDILNLVRRDAEKLYVGKKAAQHCVPQDQINDTLISLANQGKRVVRLKGGDPYIFGRGGEEAQELVNAGISFQVVPGITSATGAATYCGIPLTHRDHAQSVTFTTGHLKNGTVNLDWQHLANSKQTIVIYMGLLGLPIIAEKLTEYGLTASTPVAVVQNATRPDQKVVIGDLTSIEEKVKQANIQSPAITIVGDVVKLYHELNQDPSQTQSDAGHSPQTLEDHLGALNQQVG